MARIGTPSVPELVDAALTDPRFRAWVDDDPTRGSWYGGEMPRLGDRWSLCYLHI